ncbi:NosD domain-containing protein [Bacillus spongiae]|uniref:NosD domain-containing protein n=1 Tax=Bacillus spongiae TaxID=2683610 RepID=A0ABU8HBI9_9BACI
MKTDTSLLKAILLVNVLSLSLSSVLTLGVVIGIGIFFFNEKTIVVPDDEDTIQDAVNAAVPGDIILVKTKEDGTSYNEEVTIDKDDLKLIGIGKEKPVLDGTGVIGTGNGITLTSTASGVLVKNFIVQKFEKDGIFLDGSTSNMIIENNLIRNEEKGIELDDSNSNTIKKNNLIENEDFGIGLDNSSSNMIIRNTVKENGDSGIFLNSISINNDVFSNRAFDNQNFDIEDDDANNFKGNKCGTSQGLNVDCPK